MTGKRTYIAIREVREDYSVCPDCMFSFTSHMAHENDCEIKRTNGCLLLDDLDIARFFDEGDCLGFGMEVPDKPVTH